MRDGQILADYEAVKPLRRPEPPVGEEVAPAANAAPAADGPHGTRLKAKKAKAAKPSKLRAENWVARRGHLVTYVGLVLFTAFVYFRPYELFNAPFLREGAQWLALLTLLAYIPSQLSAEGNLTARPREVTLALLLLACALLSVPTAISPGEAWDSFVNFLKVILIFVVAVNVTRTEWRLQGLLMLAMAASLILSFSAFNDYRQGHLDFGGERVKGMIGGMFDNPNDLALHLVTMVPLAVGLAFARRGPLTKVVYLLCAALFTAGVVVSFSRGGFLGLVISAAVLAWKLGRKRRFLVGALMVVSLLIFVAAAPGEYGARLTSMFGGDVTGSASARQELFWRSVMVALRYPLTGIGLGCFYFRGAHDQVTHNAYTQVAAEMGLAALAIYVLFMVTSIRRLRRIERETLEAKDRASFYYLSVGLQAGIVGYMVCSFFASVAHLWYVYYLVAYSVALRRLYVLKYGEPGQVREEEQKNDGAPAPAGDEATATTAASLTL
jgi:putative inorganic carbon (HCO3(-)) transporter